MGVSFFVTNQIQPDLPLFSFGNWSFKHAKLVFFFEKREFFFFRKRVYKDFQSAPLFFFFNVPALNNLFPKGKKPFFIFPLNS